MNLYHKSPNFEDFKTYFYRLEAHHIGFNRVKGFHIAKFDNSVSSTLLTETLGLDIFLTRGWNQGLYTSSTYRGNSLMRVDQFIMVNKDHTVEFIEFNSMGTDYRSMFNVYLAQYDPKLSTDVEENLSVVLHFDDRERMTLMDVFRLAAL